MHAPAATAGVGVATSAVPSSRARMASTLVRRLARRHCSSGGAWSAEWAKAGLGAKRAGADATLNRLLFVETGFGCDQHGDRTEEELEAYM